ncbi:MAG: efflux RND transporter periplasmic adaptor subunit [Bryobacterales bacterium]
MREGQRVAVEADAFPAAAGGQDRTLRPALNPATRTLTALVEIANPGMRLRPQMYANVIAHPGGAARALLVPAQAVLHSGERAVVIVAKGGGLFEPREVQLGLEADGMQQILAGVTQGEEVVTSSQFLIDSESNLRAAIDMLLGNRKPGGIDHPQDSQH